MPSASQLIGMPRSSTFRRASSTDRRELTSAVKYALEKGSLIFAAVGNQGDTDIEFPAATPGVVGMGAIGKDG